MRAVPCALIYSVHATEALTVVRNRNGRIVPYAKRQIPAEVPVKSEYVPRFVPFRLALC